MHYCMMFLIVRPLGKYFLEQTFTEVNVAMIKRSPYRTSFKENFEVLGEPENSWAMCKGDVTALGTRYAQVCCFCFLMSACACFREIENHLGC